MTRAAKGTGARIAAVLHIASPHRIPDAARTWTSASAVVSTPASTLSESKVGDERVSERSSSKAAAGKKTRGLSRTHSTMKAANVTDSTSELL